MESWPWGKKINRLLIEWTCFSSLVVVVVVMGLCGEGFSFVSKKWETKVARFWVFWSRGVFWVFFQGIWSLDWVLWMRGWAWGFWQVFWVVVIYRRGRRWWWWWGRGRKGNLHLCCHLRWRWRWWRELMLLRSYSSCRSRRVLLFRFWEWCGRRRRAAHAGRWEWIRRRRREGRIIVSRGGIEEWGDGRGADTRLKSGIQTLKRGNGLGLSTLLRMLRWLTTGLRDQCGVPRLAPTSCTQCTTLAVSCSHQPRRQHPRILREAEQVLMEIVDFIVNKNIT